MTPLAGLERDSGDAGCWGEAQSSHLPGIPSRHAFACKTDPWVVCAWLVLKCFDVLELAAGAAASSSKTVINLHCLQGQASLPSLPTIPAFGNPLHVPIMSGRPSIVLQNGWEPERFRRSRGGLREGSTLLTSRRGRRWSVMLTEERWMMWMTSKTGFDS